MSDCRQQLNGMGYDISQGQTRRKYRTTFSSDQLERLERAFQTNKSLTDDGQLAQLSNETELTEARIKVWFQNRRYKLRRQERSSYCGLQEQQLLQNVDKTEEVVPKAAVEIDQNSQQNVPQRPNYSRDQLKKLECVFEGKNYISSNESEQLAKEIGLTKEQIEKWFKNRRAKQRAQKRVEEFAAVSGAKVCAQIGLMETQVKQKQNVAVASQPNANAIGVASVGSTSVSAVRGRAKCRRLFWRALTFPMNAVAKLVKKMRSTKCALANKVKKGKKEKK